MGKMYLMCGLSGAGKTTFAKKFAQEHNCVYFAIDAYYAPYYLLDKDAYDNNDISFKVWIKFFEDIHEAEMAGKDIVIDTNAPTIVKRLQFIDWFPTFEEHNLIYIMINDPVLQVKNNAARNRVVPAEEIERMRLEFKSPVEPHPYLSAFKKIGIVRAEESRWDHVDVYENVNNDLQKWEVCSWHDFVKTMSEL